MGHTFGPWEDDPFWQELAAQVPGQHLWSGTLDPSGTIAVAELSERGEDGALSDSDLWMAQREPAGWGRLEPMGSAVNTGRVENFPAFAPDGQLLVFGRDFADFYMLAVSDLVAK